MATAISSYTTVFRYCQQLPDSPAPSPGLSSTVLKWCRGHFLPPGKPASGRQLIADAGQSPLRLGGSQVFTLRSIPKHPQSGPQRRQCNRRGPARNPDSGGGR